MSTKLRSEIIHAFHRTPFTTPIIGVTGGKGGVGKTTVAVNLSSALVELGLRVALVDGDVDTPNAAILLSLSLDNPVPVQVIKPIFDESKCTDCQQCLAACRLNSLFRPKKNTILLMGECNGCEACFLVCPSDAIKRGERQVGSTWKTISGRLTVFTGELQPGLEESALVVTALKNRVFAEADQFDIIVVDTSPGTHCNVIEALKGTDFAIVVTEPTSLGAHDLDLILSLLEMFEVNGVVFINRADLPGKIEEIKQVADNHGMPIETGLKLDDQLLASYVQGVPVVKMYPQSLAAMTFTHIAENIAREYLQ